MHACTVSIFDRLAIIKCRLREGLLIFLCLMGVVFDGVVWLGLAMIWGVIGGCDQCPGTGFQKVGAYGSP